MTKLLKTVERILDLLYGSLDDINDGRIDKAQNKIIKAADKASELESAELNKESVND